MKILALESTAAAAGAAVLEDGRLLAESYQNIKLTHSQTLLPMVRDMLRNAQIPMEQIGCFAVAAGPGSFTGVRIGVSAVKGMAFGKHAPCVPVSTLLSMAYLFTGSHTYVCTAMDARCGQVYNALFEVNGNTVTRLTEDRAIPVTQLAAEIESMDHTWVVTGDGAELAMKTLSATGKALLAPLHLRYQHASGVAMAAQDALTRGETVTDAQLVPFYLRPPQAERELALKKRKEEQK